MKFFKEKKYRILKGMSKGLFIMVIVFSLVIPIFAGALTGTGNGTGTGSGTGTGTGTGTGDINISTKIENPLNSNIDSIPALIAAILNIVLVIGVPIVALAIIYTGFLFVKAQGKPDEITKAKSALVYTLIGAALLLGSWVIANAIGTTVADISSTTK